MTQTEFLCAVMLSALFCGTALAAIVGEVARWVKRRGDMQSIELSNNKGKF